MFLAGTFRIPLSFDPLKTTQANPFRRSILCATLLAGFVRSFSARARKNSKSEEYPARTSSPCQRFDDDLAIVPA
jgi:hypothetical protein